MPKLKRRILKYWPVLRVLFLLLIIGLILLIVFRFFLPTLRSLTKIGRGVNLKTSQGRVNLLILGAGGTNHQAPDLTDSLIFASVRLTDGEVVILSIPRDIWIDSLRAKINTAYYYGEEKKEGGGLVLAKAATAQILGQPVHYAVLLNFDGFVKAVDLVGGIDIEVERAFDDYQYPIPGMEEAEPEEARYEHLHFDQGWQLMDGQRALKYIRSRYAEGEEGTDFARSQRQQRFLLAFKEKVVSVKTLFNLEKVRQLVKIFGDYIETDVQEEEYAAFLKLALKLKKSQIKTFVLGEDFLVNPPKSQYDNQWVLVPKTGDWRAVQEYVESLVEAQSKTNH